MHLFTPKDLKRVVLWPAVETSSRIAAPLMPLSIIRSVMRNVADYAAGMKFVSEAEKAALEEKILLEMLRDAPTLQQYQLCAERLDEIQMHNTWKRETFSCEPQYNPRVIEDHMRELERARSTSDLSAMQHLLRTTLSRDLGGMNLLRLYKHSWSGTKNLIEDYIATVLDTIEKFATSAVEFKLETSEVQFYEQSLEDALKYFGRSALTLSGGALLGMKHIGVVKSLWEADVLPEIISGASAGSIVAAVVGVSSDEEMRGVLDVFPTADLACFDPANTTGLGWLARRASTFYRTGSFFNMDNMVNVLKPWLGDITFREAHYKTKRILNICVSSADSGEPRLLNYMTSPDVLVLSAVCASCSVPGVFPAASILEKDPVTKEIRVWMQHAKQLFVDGSLDHDIPSRKLSEMFNVNFFIVSQVNPHVRMFLEPEEEFRGRQPAHAPYYRPTISAATGYVMNATRQAVLHAAQQAHNSGIGGDWLRWASILSQNYTGDINILPDIYLEEYSYMMANPTVDFMLRATTDGERATWPKIYRIKNCVAIELALIRAIHTLRTRVNFGPDAKAAREATQTAGRGRSYSIRGQRPGFLRRRSLSTEHHSGYDLGIDLGQTSNPPTPGLPSLRRNRSFGAVERLNLSSFTFSRSQTPLVSPRPSTDQLRSSGMFDGSFRMTPGPDPAPDDLTNKQQQQQQQLEVSGYFIDREAL